MAKFRFCGDPATKNGKRVSIPTEGITAYGLAFHLKTYTKVDDEHVIAKLRGSNHFEEQTSKPKKSEE